MWTHSDSPIEKNRNILRWNSSPSGSTLLAKTTNKPKRDETGNLHQTCAWTFKSCRNGYQNVLFRGRLGGGHDRNAFQQHG
jgi:ribosomal protein L4